MPTIQIRIDEKTKNVYGSLLSKGEYEEAITLLRNARDLDIASSYDRENLRSLVLPLMRSGQLNIAQSSIGSVRFQSAKSASQSRSALPIAQLPLKRLNG